MIGNIALKIIDLNRNIEDFLDLNSNTAITIQINSPLFSFSETKGTITYPITLPWTTKNGLILNYPELLGNQNDSAIDLSAWLFLEGILYKTGIVRYLGFNESDNKKEYLINFQTDSGDFESKIREKALSDQITSTAPYSATLKDIFPLSSYALFPIRNREFTTAAGYNGYINYYHGSFLTSTATIKIPFPYLVYILHELASANGYTLEGDWLEEDLTKRLAIYNTWDLEGSSTIHFKNHVPQMKVGEFLQAVRAKFGLAYVFESTSKTIKIVKLNTVIADLSYIDWTEKAERGYGEQPAEIQGYSLEQGLEADELNKTLSTAAQTYKVGSGKETIATGEAFFHMGREADTVNTARSWLLPITSQIGSGSSKGNNKYMLRLLCYQGLQPDSAGNTYPLGSVLAQTYQTSILPFKTLRWEGEKGLYENNYKAWLDFLSTAKPISRNIRFTIEDLLTLDPTKKVMIGGIKFFWDKISLTVSMKEGINKAKINFFKTKL